MMADDDIRYVARICSNYAYFLHKYCNLIDKHLV